MKRLPALLLTLLVVLMAGPVRAVDHSADPLETIFGFFNARENQVFVARTVRKPVEGKSSTTDSEGDFEHSTGQAPGYTPDHVDILATRALLLVSESLELFPATGKGLWAETGPNQIEPPDEEPIYTLTGEVPHDGSQYDDGSYLFGFTLAAPLPVDVEGRCEYVVWVNDLSRGPTFVNHANFPNDPAGGSNVAFGLGINSEGGGESSSFALELSKTGGFAPNPETDVRSWITGDYVGITVPSGAIGQLAEVNFYTFCAESGLGFDPEDSGADQTGLIEMTDDDLGIVEVVALSAVAEATTTTVQRTSTTVVPDEPEPTTVAAEKSDPGSRGFPWWLAILGALGLGIMAFWLLAKRDDACREPSRASQAAQKACFAAQKIAVDAAKRCKIAHLDLAHLEDERQVICRDWPPICWDTEDGDWIEDARGNRITARDVHMRKMALGEAWDDYKDGELSATQIEAKWREMDTPQFREEMVATEHAFKDLLEETDDKITIARELLGEACNMSAQAQRNADEACADAAIAKDALDDCKTREGAAKDQT
jgi:hypothetical protein